MNPGPVPGKHPASCAAILLLGLVGMTPLVTLTACPLQTQAASPAQPSAAEADTLRLLEEVVVWGDRLHAVTGYASRVDIIDRQRIRAAQRDPAANVLSSVNSLPGVVYRKVGLIANGASGDPPAAFRVRGVGSIPNDGLLILVDGRPQYVGVWGHALPDAHRLGPVQRVEVARGPQSVQFGSQAFAGVINIVTAGAERPGAEVQIAGGNHGTYGASLDQRGAAGPATYALSASRARSDGYRGGDEGRVDGFRARLSMPLSDSWQVSALADGTDSFFDNPGPESAPYPDPDQGSGDIRQRAVDLRLEGHGRTWTTRLVLFHNAVHNDFHLAGNTRARDYGARLFAENSGSRATLKAGFDLERYGGSFRVNGNPALVPVDKYDINAAPYLLAQYDLSPPVSVAAGLRANFSDRYATEWIPQARLRARLAPRTQWILSAAKGFKTPSVAQQYLPFFAGDRSLLEPERMWQYELGISHNAGSWAAEAAFYVAEGSNLIRQVGFAFPPQYDNSGEFRHQGLEVSVRGRLDPQTTATASATWALERDDQTLATPAAAYRLDLQLNPLPSLRCDLTVEAELGRFGEDGHRDRLRDLLLTSLGLSWDLPAAARDFAGARSELFVHISNLANRSYRVFTDYPMPDRTWAVGLRMHR